MGTESYIPRSESPYNAPQQPNFTTEVTSQGSLRSRPRTSHHSERPRQYPWGWQPPRMENFVEEDYIYCQKGAKSGYRPVPEFFPFTAIAVRAIYAELFSVAALVVDYQFDHPVEKGNEFLDYLLHRKFAVSQDEMECIKYLYFDKGKSTHYTAEFSLRYQVLEHLKDNDPDTDLPGVYPLSYHDIKRLCRDAKRRSETSHEALTHLRKTLDPLVFRMVKLIEEGGITLEDRIIKQLDRAERSKDRRKAQNARALRGTKPTRPSLELQSLVTVAQIRKRPKAVEVANVGYPLVILRHESEETSMAKAAPFLPTTIPTQDHHAHPQGTHTFPGAVHTITSHH
ncbi:MAG: hypothetical protein Q9218_002556 [Villophora microphyllina]